MAVESASSLSKVQFAIGNEVSAHCHFFKSSFARSLVKNVRDCKSLDYELHNNNTIIEETSECNVDDRNNNFFSLLDFRCEKTTTTTMTTTTTTMTTTNTNSNNRTSAEKNNQIAICDASVPIESDQSNVNIEELERLRKEFGEQGKICRLKNMFFRTSHFSWNLQIYEKDEKIADVRLIRSMLLD
ncbi:putative transcriptional regulator cudA [Polistes fuscatus]|uniref:putative transcriptional regulator cudA n=1 Tax=Polistes fuscatus TaxID=30207 RepID=UPI001CA7F69A|nr:putative transcriptional regulator cudA [Polistes fuscatus]